VPAVEGGHLGLVQRLARDEHRRVDQAEPDRRISGLEPGGLQQLVLVEAVDGEPAADGLLHERQPGGGRGKLSDPVVQLDQHGSGDQQVFVGLLEQAGTAFVVGIGGVERRVQDAGV
jgi:hypothetical protein